MDDDVLKNKQQAKSIAVLANDTVHQIEAFKHTTTINPAGDSGYEIQIINRPSSDNTYYYWFKTLDGTSTFTTLEDGATSTVKLEGFHFDKELQDTCSYRKRAQWIDGTITITSKWGTRVISGAVFTGSTVVDAARTDFGKSTGMFTDISGPGGVIQIVLPEYDGSGSVTVTDKGRLAFLNAPKVTITSSPSEGTAVVQSNGEVLYTPNPGTEGVDSFQYQVMTELGDMDLATVNIGTIDLDISDLNGGELDEIAEDNPGLTLPLNIDDDNGNAVVDLQDVGFADSDLAKLTIEELAPAALRPLNGYYTISFDSNIIKVWHSQDKLSAAGFSEPYVISGVTRLYSSETPSDFELWVEGVATCTTAIQLSWHDTTANLAAVFDSVSVSVVDMTPPHMPGMCVTSRHAPTLNKRPYAINDYFTLLHNDTIYGDVLLNDGDPDGDQVQIMIQSYPAHGAIRFQRADMFMCDDGGFQYVPDANFTGTDTFTYTTWDGLVESAVATVSFNVTNYAPVALDDNFIVSIASERLSGNVMANDYDSDTADGDIVRTVLIQGPQHGELKLNDDGTFNYVPESNYVGTDAFTYKLTDGMAEDSATVSIITEEKYGDLDIAYDPNQPVWVNEGDEYEFGAAVSMDGPLELLATVPLTPESSGGPKILSRTIQWDPTLLSIGGSIAGTLVLPNDAGSVILQLAQHTAGVVSSYVTYTLVTQAGSTETTSTNTLKVGGPEAHLEEIEFTSDHGVLRDNKRNILSDEGALYNSVEYKRGIRSEPISQTWQTPVSLKVRWSTAGFDVGTQLRVVGASALPQLSLDFESAPKTLTKPGGLEEWQITSKQTLPRRVWFYLFDMDWKLQKLEANGQWVDVATQTTSHDMNVTAGDPRETGGPATAIRMHYSVGRVGGAVEDKLGWQNNPTPAEIVYHTLNSHKFNLNRAWVAGFAKRAWTVPSTWPYGGSDCISGALWTQYVTEMVGVPGSIKVRTLAAQSFDAYTTAIDFTVDRFVWVTDNAGRMFRRYLYHIDHNNKPNRFEAVVVYSDSNNTYYFPSGARGQIYRNADDVLTVFDFIAWVNPDKTYFATRAYAPAQEVPESEVRRSKPQ